MMKQNFVIGSRFATQKEALSPQFMKLNRELDQINVRYDLPDHTDFNEFRYPWSARHLSQPAFYAARLWEYPYTFYAGEFKKNMKVLDVGCGMNPFTIYLQEISRCRVTGADPDLFDTGVKYKCHGISQKYIKKTGLNIVEAGMEKLPFKNNSFDRVMCISVVEHVDRDIAKRGIQEMARVLKPKGRLILTLDVNLLAELGRPLDFIWDSNLLPLGGINLRWPYKRFGNFCDGMQPADVYGLALIKDPYTIQMKYSNKRGKPEQPTWRIPSLQKNFAKRLERKYQREQEQMNKQATLKSTKTDLLLSIINKFFS